MCTTFGFSFIIEVKKTAFYVKIKGFVCKVYKKQAERRADGLLEDPCGTLLQDVRFKQGKILLHFA